jgi:drug/metabolite transporter (DMT)-like permease
MKVLLLNLSCALFAVTSTSMFKSILTRELTISPSLSENIKNSLKLLFLPTFWLALFCFATGCLLWFYILTTMRMSVVYPLQIALVFILGTSASIIFFEEKITDMHFLGLITILIGIFIMIK